MAAYATLTPDTRAVARMGSKPPLQLQLLLQLRHRRLLLHATLTPDTSAAARTGSKPLLVSSTTPMAAAAGASWTPHSCFMPH
jgi:hypothetical protein